jgi:hypothetical protein
MRLTFFIEHTAYAENYFPLALGYAINYFPLAKGIAINILVPVTICR